MKTLTKTALVAVGVALATQGARAYTANDLIIGFNGGTTDYTVDLGSATTAVGVGGTSVVDLSGDLTVASLNPIFAQSVNVGVVGGKPLSTFDVYETGLRTGVGAASSPGSTSVPPVQITPGANLNAAAQLLSSLELGSNPTADAGSWDSVIASTPTTTGTGPASFSSKLNSNPLSTISGNTIEEDLYFATHVGTGNASAWTYEGFFTLTLTPGSGAPLSAESLTFTPATLAVAVPEPSTYGALAGLGLLALSLRRQLGRKTA